MGNRNNYLTNGAKPLKSFTMTKRDKLSALEFFLKHDDLMKELVPEMNYLYDIETIILIAKPSFTCVFINRFAAFCELYRIQYSITNNQIQTL